MIFKRLIVSALCAMSFAASAAADIETYLNGFCDAQDFDTEQCACTKTTFEVESALRELTSEQRAMAALFLGQTGLDVMVFAEAMQSMNPDLMPSVIPVIEELQAPIYQTCIEVDANTFTATEADIGERYLQACTFMTGQAEEDKALCACQRDAFAGQFDDETFLLMTELAEIEAGGLAGDQDPLEYLLKEQRGLSNEEATDLLMANQGVMMSAPAIILNCAQDVMGLDSDLKGLLEGVMSTNVDE